MKTKLNNSPSEHSKVFFSYTPQDYKNIFIADTRKETIKQQTKPYGDRATIAMQYIGNGTIVYGVAICDSHDHFDKTEGRKLAYERMMENFAIIDVKNFDFSNKDFNSVMLVFLDNITKSIYFNYGKYNLRIQTHNKIQKVAKTAKSIEIKEHKKEVHT